jgi:uncharacterized protein (TIGR02001 family)
MKKSVMKGMVAGLALAAAAPVFASQSANVSVTSNYLFRGLTQTADGAALQGGYDYDFENGFAVGIWGSNVEAGLEYDLYGSYSGTSGDFGYSVSYLMYNYTDSSFSPNLTETAVGVSYKDFSLDYYLGDGYNYMDLGYGTDVSGVGVSLHYGSQTTTGGLGDFTDYSLGADKDFSGYDVGLTYTSNTPKGGSATTAFALSVSKSFDL